MQLCNMQYIINLKVSMRQAVDVVKHGNLLVKCGITANLCCKMYIVATLFCYILVNICTSNCSLSETQGLWHTTIR